METGDVIASRFEIEGWASTGGMATVYRAHDLITGEPVALKVLTGTADGTADVPRFAREARVLAEMRHPGIVRYIAHGTTLAGELYLAMEWLDGEDLGQRLSRAPLSLPESVGLAITVAETLSVLHGRGIVHRDIKPENLFLLGGNVSRVKVLDLGLVRQHGGVRATREGLLLGTPGYMAPEQVRGARDIDVRADVFALGCVLFECLTGRCPFDGESVITMLGRTLLEDSPRVRSLRTDVPEALDELLARMLSREVSGRPPDGAAVAEALRAVGPLHPFDPDLPTTPPVLFPPSLGVAERRLLSVVLVGAADDVAGTVPSDGGAPADDPTRPGGTSPGSPRGTLGAALDDATRPGIGRGAGGPAASTLRLAAESFGAQFELLADGSAMAVLQGAQGMGPPTDQAARAARCALALRGFAPTSRMALATGWGEVSGRWPVGDVIDRAARLLRDVPAMARVKTPTGTVEGLGMTPEATARPVRVDDVTAGLLDARFEVGGDASGLDLRGEREVVESARTLLGLPTPCVGRRRELTTLAALLDECLEEPVARAVLVTAPPGMGKTRVRQEFVAMARRRAPALEVWSGRGDPIREGAPFGMVAAPLRALAGIRVGEALAVRQKKLRARVARHVEAEHVGRVAEFLGELVGTTFPDDGSVPLRAARQDAVLMGDQMRRAFVDFVVAECSAHPVLLVLEDLQWGDIPSVQFVDAAMRALADRAFMVLAVGRPEVHGQFPGLWAERGLQEIRLGELTRKAGEELARAVLGTSADPMVVARVVDRAAGNALYLEELLRAVAMGRGAALPGSVLAMMHARLDALTPEARRTLRAAAVFGPRFWRSGVAALLGMDPHAARLGDWLGELCDREVVHRRADSRFPGEEEYGFRHAPLRDAAYATLTEADLTLGHRLAGTWLERTGERDAVVLGEHYERGDAGEEAVGWYRRAAEQALEGNDLGGVLARTERGVACGAAGDVLGALRLLQAEAHRWRGENRDAARSGREALRWLPRGAARWFAAVGETALAYGRLGDTGRLVALASALRDVSPGVPVDPVLVGPWATATARLALQALNAGIGPLAGELFEALEAAAQAVVDNPTAAARVHQARAGHALATGEPAVARSELDAAARCFDTAGDQRSACGVRAGVGFATLTLGDTQEAAALLEASQADAVRLRLHHVAAVAALGLSQARARAGALEEARVLCADAVAAFTAQGDRRMEGAARTQMARIELAAGEVTAARRTVAAAVAVLKASPPARSVALAVQSRAEAAGGDREAALTAADEAAKVADALGGLEGEPEVRLAHADALAAVGRQEEAHRVIDRARGWLLERTARIAHPPWRTLFVTNVPEHAETLDRATAWLGDVPAR